MATLGKDGSPHPIRSLTKFCTILALSFSVMSIGLTSCGSTKTMTTSPLVSFTSGSWIGGSYSRVPGLASKLSLRLTSSASRPSSAQLITHLNMSRYSWERSVLELTVYVTNVGSLNTNIYGSRIQFASNFAGTNAYIAWLDAIHKNGWNTVEIPLTFMAIIGKPNRSDIVSVALTIYSDSINPTSVYFVSLGIKKV